MTTYKNPQTTPPPTSQPNEVFLIASGDSRLSANHTYWPAQADMERKIIESFADEGVTIRRAHPYDKELNHGFIWNPPMGTNFSETANKSC